MLHICVLFVAKFMIYFHVWTIKLAYDSIASSCSTDHTHNLGVIFPMLYKKRTNFKCLYQNCIIISHNSKERSRKKFDFGKFWPSGQCRSRYLTKSSISSSMLVGGVCLLLDEIFDFVKYVGRWRLFVCLFVRVLQVAVFVRRFSNFHSS